MTYGFRLIYHAIDNFEVVTVKYQLSHIAMYLAMATFVWEFRVLYYMF